jgi:GT2 family glycosyltransferase
MRSSEDTNTSKNIFDIPDGEDKALFTKIRIVASYTTLPSRYDALTRSIESLKHQTHKLDAIYVAIPRQSTRLNKEYPPVPSDLAALCTIIRTDIDYGPLTKIYGALISETDPDTVIISCDDDVFFDPNYIDIMLQHHKTHPKSAICGTGALIGRGLPFISIVSTVRPFHEWSGFTGFDIDNRGRRVDLIFGVAGVLYTRGLFPSNELLHDELFKYSLMDDSIFHNDDVLISGYLSKQGIERRIFFNIPSIHHDSGKDALSSDIFKMLFRLNASIKKVKEFGFFPTMEEVPLDETPTSRVIFTIIILIAIVILCIYLYKAIS